MASCDKPICKVERVTRNTAVRDLVINILKTNAGSKVMVFSGATFAVISLQ